jgi:hypothetical protein
MKMQCPLRDINKDRRHGDDLGGVPPAADEVPNGVIGVRGCSDILKNSRMFDCVVFRFVTGI